MRAPELPTLQGDEQSGSATPEMAGHRRGKRRARVRRRHRIVKIVVCTVVALVMVTGLGMAYLYRHLNGNLTILDASGDIVGPRPDKLAATGPHEPLNILVMGSDSRDCNGCNIDNLTGEGQRSDTTILVHLSADRKHAYGISIPRDSMVDRPECKDKDGHIIPAADNVMWNEAFSAGGPACTIAQLEHLSGIRVDHFVVVDFESFKSMVDALGGVEVCIPETWDDRSHGIYLKAGTRKISGDQALKYVRIRHGIGDGSDLGRMKRQQAFVGSMANQLLSSNTLANPVHVVKFLDAATKGLTVDPGLGNLKKLGQMAYGFKDIGLNKIQFLTIPSEYDPADPNRVIWTPDAQKVWTAIKHDKPLNKQLTAGAIKANTVPGASGSGTPSASSGSSPSQSPSGSPSGSPTASPSGSDGGASSPGAKPSPQQTEELQQAGLCA